MNTFQSSSRALEPEQVLELAMTAGNCMQSPSWSRDHKNQRAKNGARQDDHGERSRHFGPFHQATPVEFHQGQVA